MSTLLYTRKRANPWLATSEDGLNMAFGKTRKAALQTLAAGIAARRP
jgi:hypothetical protein